MNLFKNSKIKSHSPDYIFIIAIVVLVVFGLSVLISASSVVSFRNYDDSYFKVKQQIFHGSVSGQSQQKPWPIMVRPSSMSKASRPPTGCAWLGRSKTTFPASTAANSSVHSTHRSCRCNSI